jgi:chemotaxis protein methyltransferase WspC
MSTARFSDLLKLKMGLDANAIGMAAIDRAVRQRVNACAAADDDAYWRLLLASPQEQQQLIETVVVPETSFFRHPESMEILAPLARQRAAGGGAVRVVSLPCSSGEEPYTIAMTLLEAGLDAASFSVLGVDISDRLVAHAEQGIYGRNSFRGDALAYRDRHFTETPRGFSVVPRVRAQVRFATGNILDAGLALPSAEFDFVFCRNLLIYFDGPTQEAAVGVLRRLCRQDGYIFVGPAEASLLTRMGMKQIEAPHAFAFRNAPAVQAGSEPAHARARAAHAGARAPSAQRRHAAVPIQARAGVPRAVPARVPTLQTTSTSPSTSSLPSTSSTPSPSTPATHMAPLDAIQALADAGRIAEALAAASAHLKDHGASAPAYYLIGVLQDAAGATRDAEAAYRKALYLEPAHREALLHLASLVESRGDTSAARQLRQRAARGGDGHA